MTVTKLLRRRVVLVPLLVLGVYLGGVTSVRFAPSGSDVAVWWPAAGLAVIAVLYSPRRLWWLVLLGVVVSSGLANYTAGRSTEVAVGFGLANSLEALAVAYWVTRGVTGRPALLNQEDFWRLLTGTLLGVLLIGAGGGLTVSYFLDGDFILTMRTLVPSHAASILVIVPLALATTRLPPVWSSREGWAQTVVLVALTAYVFSPGQQLALTFLPMAALAWGALRSGTRTLSRQLLVVGVLTTAASARDWGPFALAAQTNVTSPETTGSLIQAFLTASALIMLPLAIAVEQRRMALVRVSDSEEMFRKSFTDSMIGMALLRHADGRLVVVEVNETADAILGSGAEPLVGADWGALVSPRDESLESIVQDILSGARPGWRDEIDVVGESYRRVAVSLSALSLADGDPMFTAQMVDITAAHDANHRLRTEKDFNSAILDTTGCVIIVVDINTGEVVGVNPAAQDVTGFAEDEVRDRPIWETLVPEVDRDAMETAYSTPRGAAIPLTYEGDLVTKSGGRRRITWSNAFLADENGARTHVVMTGIDVTTERTTAGLVSHLMRAATTTALIGTDLDGRITVFNSGAEQMLGYPGREMIGRCLPKEVFDDAQIARRAAREGAEPDLTLLTSSLRKTGKPQTGDWTVVRRDGSRFTASITISSVTDTFGQHIGYLGVGNDVTEQRRTQDLLLAALEKEREAVDRLSELDQAKSDFVSTVSHELRTPITSITGYTEMLQDGAAGDLTASQLKLIDAVSRNGERLIALADDLLTLSSFESGTFTAERVEVDLRAVVARAQEALQPLTVDRRLDVTFSTPHLPVVVWGDARHLERVVFNLMSNAVKFTEDGGRIRCVLSAPGDDAVLEVTDTGIGIPEAEQEGLFTRFFRSSTAQQHAIQGTGLGLSIVASIIADHSGDITVESAHLRGTTFTVRLPLVERMERPSYAGAHAAR